MMEFNTELNVFWHACKDLGITVTLGMVSMDKGTFDEIYLDNRHISVHFAQRSPDVWEERGIVTDQRERKSYRGPAFIRWLTGMLPELFNLTVLSKEVIQQHMIEMLVADLEEEQNRIRKQLQDLEAMTEVPLATAMALPYGAKVSIEDGSLIDATGMDQDILALQLRIRESQTWTRLVEGI